MIKIILTHKVENVERWKGFEAERISHLGRFADDVRGSTLAGDGNSVAVSMEVVDPTGLEALMSTEECAELLKRHGVMQPVQRFVAVG